MSEFWGILWAIVKWTAIIGGSFALISFLVALFHPVTFTFLGRASARGQRGEVYLSYLFNLLKIRFIASAHTQDVWIEFCGIKKLVQREGRTRAKGVERQGQSQSQGERQSQKVIPPAPLHEKGVESHGQSQSQKVIPPAPLYEKGVESHGQSQSQGESQSQKVIPPAPLHEKWVEDNEEAEYRVEATPEQMAQLKEILEQSESTSEDEATATENNDWAKKARKFKKDFNRRYDQLRGKLRLIRQKWNSIWPIIKRFWGRGKKGFQFHTADLKVAYSLEEYHLTGMLAGYLAPTIGFAQQHGLRFQPVPTFPEKPGWSIYTRAKWGINIRPYRLAWAVVGLFFEKNLYKELIWLYKQKRKKS